MFSHLLAFLSTSFKRDLNCTFLLWLWVYLWSRWGQNINTELCKVNTQHNSTDKLLLNLSHIPGRRQTRSHNLQCRCRNQFYTITQKNIMSWYFQEDDEGSYSCVAENVLGQTSSVAYLSVNSAQVIIIETVECSILIDKQLRPNISK